MSADPKPTPEQWNCGNHQLRAQCVAGYMIAALQYGKAFHQADIQAIDDVFLECGAAYCRALLDNNAFANTLQEVPF